MRAATLTFLAEHRLARTDALTDRLVDRIEDGNPGYRETGVVPRDDLRHSCHDNIVRVLELPVGAGFVVVAAHEVDLRRADTRLAPHGTAWVRRTEGVVGLVALRDDSPDEALAGLRALASAENAPVGVSTVLTGCA